MTTIDTQHLTANTPVGPFENLQIYNGLDCCITFEVSGKSGAPTQQANQSGAQSMTSNEHCRDLTCPSCGEDFSWTKSVGNTPRENLRDSYRWVAKYPQHFVRCSKQWCRLNPRSPAQLKSFLYGAEGMRLPEQWLSFKGVNDGSQRQPRGP